MSYQEIPASVANLMQKITDLCQKDHPRWAENFNAAFANTLLTTIKRQADGTTFVLTGDIPAMWLRDSTAQVRPYLVLTKEDADLRAMIAGLVQRQFFYINIDPYANAFNETANGAGYQDDHTIMNDWIWERKYEVDSLCYPIQLAYLLYKNSGETSHFNDTFVAGVKKILDLFTLEQNHEDSSYSFMRDTHRKEDTLSHNGQGTPVAYTGMTWSGFRPSDDACIYGYLVPSNMFAVVVLGYLEEIFTGVIANPAIVEQAKQLRKIIHDGIKKHAHTTNKSGNSIFAYEVDGFGNSLVMDDSNVPNLISAPYLGFCRIDDVLYQETRKTLLSAENPYYYEGKYAKGIGSSHTPPNYVWPIALAMEGLTSNQKAEKERILNLLVAIDGGTKMMHEGVDVNDPNAYTREWFSWANMMFCELVMDYYDIRVER